MTAKNKENVLHKNNCQIPIMCINAYFISKRLIVYVPGELHYLIRHICLKEISYYWIGFLYYSKYFCTQGGTKWT